jgi:hypothetical protein
MNTVMIIFIVMGNTVVWHVVPYNSYEECYNSLKYEMTISEKSTRWCMDGKNVTRK